jgi:hypothetical protein
MSPYLATGPEARSCLGMLARTMDHAASKEAPVGSGTKLRKRDGSAFYRLRTTTIGLKKGDIHPVVISMPAGSLLRVPDGIANAVGMIEVEWDGEAVQMFAVDVHACGESIKAIGVGRGEK